MGLFDFLSALKPNPTAKWVADPNLELQFDFNTHALCRVKVGDAAEKLATLGPAEDAACAKRGQYRYFTRGIEIRVDEDTVQSFRLVWNSDADMDFLPFRGDCRQGNKHVEMTSETVERELLDLFSLPFWRDQRDDCIVLFYEFSDVEWQFQLLPDGRLGALTVTTDPLLAKDSERKRLQVTKEWPW